MSLIDGVLRFAIAFFTMFTVVLVSKTVHSLIAGNSEAVTIFASVSALSGSVLFASAYLWLCRRQQSAVRRW